MLKESIKSDGEDDLQEAAEAIVKRMDRYGIVAFYGPMGAGKTTLIREICRQRGVEDTVTSPTFALVNQYLDAGGETIYHFDFYRIEKIEEVYDLGYEEYFYGGLPCLIEWPEKIGELLPEEILKVRIEITGDESRLITIEEPEALQ